MNAKTALFVLLSAALCSAQGVDSAAAPAAAAEPAPAAVAAEPAPAPEAAEAAAPAPETAVSKPAPAPAPEVPLPAQTASAPDQLSTSKNNVFQDVEIFGDNWIFSPTIWSDMLKLDNSDAMVQQNIEEKKFANDEYFMRNVDREEFEEERVLLMFEEKARRYEKYLRKMREEIAADSAAAASPAPAP